MDNKKQLYKDAMDLLTSLHSAIYGAGGNGIPSISYYWDRPLIDFLAEVCGPNNVRFVYNKPESQPLTKKDVVDEINRRIETSDRLRSFSSHSDVISASLKDLRDWIVERGLDNERKL
jgi:hypothetical protein